MHFRHCSDTFAQFYSLKSKSHSKHAVFWLLARTCSRRLIDISKLNERITREVSNIYLEITTFSGDIHFTKVDEENTIIHIKCSNSQMRMHLWLKLYLWSKIPFTIYNVHWATTGNKFIVGNVPKAKKTIN